MPRTPTQTKRASPRQNSFGRNHHVPSNDISACSPADITVAAVRRVRRRSFARRTPADLEVPRRCGCALSSFKELGVPPPTGDGPQGDLRVAADQVVFEFGRGTHPGRATVIEKPSNMRGQRHELEQMLIEKPLALFAFRHARTRAPLQ